MFGASGRTGEPLVEQALAAGHDVVAFVRDPARLSVDGGRRLTVVTGDAYTGEGVAEAVGRGGDPVDAVVSVLGQTDDGPDDLLTVAGDNVLEAMADAGVDRLVTLVGAGVRAEGESVTLTGRLVGLALRLFAGEALADAEEHVARVRASDRAWTVVRAPRLTDGPAEGYRHGDLALGFGAVTRADVAAFILDCLRDGRYLREMPKVGPA